MKLNEEISRMKSIMGLIIEQVVTTYDTIWDYKKEGDKYYTKKKNGGEWKSLSGEPLEVVKSKVFRERSNKNNNEPKQSQSCPAFPKSSGVNNSLFPKYQSEAKVLMSSGIPKRSACEISFVKIRPEYQNKPFFVVDTLQNLIYLFDKNGMFVAKSPTLDGYHAQSQDVNVVAKALWSMDERAVKHGYVWDKNKKIFTHSKDKNKTMTVKQIYDLIDKDKSRFIPKGIYSIRYITTKPDYVGGEDNMFLLQTSDGKKLNHAIHGFYNEPPRVEALKKLKKSIKTDINSPTVPSQFLKLVQDYMNTSEFNKSYGCINVPEDFIKKAQPYAKMNANIFVVGETEQNYLVQNDTKFFEQMGVGEQCVNPATLGNEIPQLDNLA